MKERIAMIHVGHSKATAQSITATVMKVLECKNADEATKVAALATLSKAFEIHAVVTGCNFTTK